MIKYPRKKKKALKKSLIGVSILKSDELITALYPKRPNLLSFLTND